MDNKILNKQIPLETIIKIADYLEDYKENYDKKFELEINKNKNLPYGEKKWEYENGSTSISYTIELKNGKTMKENNYNWFITNLNNPKGIQSIYISVYVSFFTKSSNSTMNDLYNKIDATLYFREKDCSIDVNTTNQESQAHNLYSTLMNILEDNKDRYDKTMKYVGVRTQCFTISVGLILSYILFIALKININKLPELLVMYMNNKYVLILGQWFISILLGNLASYWFIYSIYKPLLPETKYVGYNYSNNTGMYKDDVDEYIGHSEIHFGKYWDAEKRRNTIEKIYKFTKIILLIQLLISIVLLLILN